MNQDHYAQLREIVSMLDDLPGDGEAIMAQHIDVAALIEVATERITNALDGHMGIDMLTSASEEEFMHKAMTAAYMDGFAAGAAWDRMRAGGSE